MQGEQTRSALLCQVPLFQAAVAAPMADSSKASACYGCTHGDPGDLKDGVQVVLEDLTMNGIKNRLADLYTRARCNAPAGLQSQ